MPIISVKKVSFAYKSDLVLDDVSFTISQNEAVAVIGPNGGGKTTLLKLLMGFLKPSQGSISLFDMDPKESRDRVGYVPQRLAFDAKFPITTREVVLMGAISKLSLWGSYPSWVKEKAKATLETVGLQDKQHARFGTLSGGQMQRALIARALMTDPDILFLDEATSSIDPYAEQTLLELFQEIGKGRTIIMVTHELDAVIKNVQKVLCIQHKVTLLDPQDVCEHFVQGLYHPPLLGENKK